MQKDKRMNPKIERLRAQQKGIEARIKKLEKEEREATRSSALRLIEKAGLLDLTEAELTNRLGALLAPRPAQNPEV